METISGTIFYTANEDYIDRTMNLTLSNKTTPRNCFNISIVNDDRYELKEEFLVNITTLDLITLSYITIVIVDEDGKFSGLCQNTII